MKNKFLITILFVGFLALTVFSQKKVITEKVRPEVEEAVETATEQKNELIDKFAVHDDNLASDEASIAEDEKIELIATEDGQTAYELLESKHEVEAKEYDFGVFVESIDGLAGDDSYYWAFYLNGEYAEQGIAQTILETGDKIELRYEKIQLQK